MTRDEAIKEIDDLRCDIGSAYDDANLSPIWNALGMAIDALQKPREQCIAKIELPEEELERIFQKVLHEQVPVPERKTGRWINHGEDGYVECPFCGHLTTCEGNIEDLHYCFWCGTGLEADE